MSTTIDSPAPQDRIDAAIARHRDRRPERGRIVENTTVLASAASESRLYVALEETYPGRNPRTGEPETRTDRTLINEEGLSFQAPAGDPKALAKKLRDRIATRIDDEALLPYLVNVVDATKVLATGTPSGSSEDARLGQLAWVYAMGRWRRGIVLQAAAKRTTVAYTTASSNGRIFRKAESHDSVHLEEGVLALPLLVGVPQPTVTVRIENAYTDGHQSEHVVVLPEPPRGLNDGWWNNDVLDHTGDGHGLDSRLGWWYGATIIEATNATLVGEEYEWSGN